MESDAPSPKEYLTTIRLATRKAITSQHLKLALTNILFLKNTLWDGESLVETLDSQGFEIETDPEGQPLFLDELTEVVRALNLRVALTKTRGVGRWVFQLVAPTDDSR